MRDRPRGNRTAAMLAAVVLSILVPSLSGAGTRPRAGGAPPADRDAAASPAAAPPCVHLCGAPADRAPEPSPEPRPGAMPDRRGDLDLQGRKQAQLRTEKVVIVVIDGPRAEEFFSHPTHAYIPHIWNELRPQAYLSHAFFNYGWTLTVSGHASIATGTYQYLNNAGTDRPTQPTMWEYFRAATGGSRESAVMVSFKDKLDAIQFSDHPEYGDPYGANYIGPLWSDALVVDSFFDYADQYEPDLALLALGGVDMGGHSEEWWRYTGAIELADALTVEVWTWLQSHPAYAGRTAMFVTSDHGRHTVDWCCHGDGCTGCRNIPFLALGPDFLSGVEATGPFAQQIDLCETVGALLGFPTPYSNGRVMTEIFLEPAAVEHPFDPVAAAQRTDWRLQADPIPARGPVRIRLSAPGADPFAATWRANLFDATGRRAWSGSVPGSSLRGGWQLDPPASMPGTGAAWLLLRAEDSETPVLRQRILWVR